MTRQGTAATQALETAMLGMERDLQQMGGYFMGDIGEPVGEEDEPDCDVLSVHVPPDCDLLSMLVPLLRALHSERERLYDATPEELADVLRSITALLAMVDGFERYHFTVGDVGRPPRARLTEATTAVEGVLAVFAPVSGSA